MSRQATEEQDEVLGLRWGGLHSCGQRVELLWVTPVLAVMQGLPACVHLDLAGATLTFGKVVCDKCGLELLVHETRGVMQA